MRFSLSLLPGLFPRGRLGTAQDVLGLALGLGATKPGPGEYSIQIFRAGHGAWAGGLFPSRVCCCCCCVVSVVSDSVRPQRRQPTRLPRPWDSPGKNTGVGCHFLLQCVKVKSESEVALAHSKCLITITYYCYQSKYHQQQFYQRYGLNKTSQ